MSESWSREEVEATVSDYLDMLTKQLTGQQYSKSDHRRRLVRLLHDRSEGAIERKHQNISAVLIELHCPWISGYKPLGNYQALLFEVVEDRLRNNSMFDQAALAAVQMPAAVPEINDFSEVAVEPPRLSHSAQEAKPSFAARSAAGGSRRDYIERETRNASLGLAGERFILQYEQWRLISLGKEKLAAKIEHASVTQGDGLGFDILSFDAKGRERLIEVKTTTFGKETPFFITSNEVARSKADADIFHVYRLFDFRKAPRLFSFIGPVDRHCHLNPVTYLASFS
jgi:hypothetical protein